MSFLFMLCLILKSLLIVLFNFRSVCWDILVRSVWVKEIFRSSCYKRLYLVTKENIANIIRAINRSFRLSKRSFCTFEISIFACQSPFWGWKWKSKRQNNFNGFWCVRSTIIMIYCYCRFYTLCKMQTRILCYIPNKSKYHVLLIFDNLKIYFVTKVF